MIRDLWALTKPGITRLVLVVAAAGYYLAAGRFDPVLLVHLLFGTALVASGTNGLNQWWERDVDALMHRTRARPLPSGRLDPSVAFRFSVLCGAIGVVYLLLFTRPITAGLALLTLVSYVTVYTPLKKRTESSTLIGAIPGALPILGGWTAGGGELTGAAGVLFAILVTWQMPHFLALAFLYREDYRRGGLAVMGVDDLSGRRGAGHAVLYAMLLVAATVALAMLGVAGPGYAVGVAVAGLGFVAMTWAHWRDPTVRTARRVFLASVVYLPIVLTLAVVDRTPCL